MLGSAHPPEPFSLWGKNVCTKRGDGKQVCITRGYKKKTATCADFPHLELAPETLFSTLPLFSLRGVTQNYVFAWEVKTSE